MKDSPFNNYPFTAKSPQKKPKLSRDLLMKLGIAILVIIVIGGVVFGISSANKQDSKDDKQQTEVSQDNSNSQPKEDSSNNQKSEDKPQSPTTDKSSDEQANSATPQQDAASIGELISSTYGSGTASTNTCNKVVSSFSYNIVDQKTATATATVVTQSQAGGNTIALSLSKSGDKWSIKTATCS